MSRPSPTAQYCQDSRAQGHGLSSGTARGRDRTVPRVGLNEGRCSTTEGKWFGRMEADSGEVCVHVSVQWWWEGQASHDWEASMRTGTGSRNLYSLRPLGVSPAGAVDDEWGWNFSFLPRSQKGLAQSGGTAAAQ